MNGTHNFLCIVHAYALYASVPYVMVARLAGKTPLHALVRPGEDVYIRSMDPGPLPLRWP